MSNDLMLMDAQLPAHLQQGGGDLADSLITTGPSITRLSIKGSKFTLKRGQESTPIKLLELGVVIIAASPLGALPAKTYYANKFVEGEDTQPTCMSSDGVRPDSSVATPQSTTTCAKCPMNAWGSRKTEDGRDAKACQDTKVLYVLAVSSDGTVKDEVVQLRVPATSLKKLSQYAGALKSRKFPMNGVVTKLSFVDDVAYPQLQFDFGGFLEADQYAVAKEAAASDIIAQVLKGELPIEEPAAQPVTIQEAPKPAPKPAPKTEVTPSVFDDDDIEEDDEEIEEEEADVDADGREWDERIDSGNKKKGKNGKWMKRRGVDMDEYKRIRAELLGKSQPVVEQPAEPTPTTASPLEDSPTEIDDELDALLADLG